MGMFGVMLVCIGVIAPLAFMLSLGTREPQPVLAPRTGRC